MTAVALRSVVAKVPVILPVTADADRRGLRGTRRLAMAGRALQIGVTARQGKMRLLRMIETPLRPAIRRMTGLAFLAQPALVHVVVRMTAVATGARLLEGQGGVTLGAAHDPMQAKQREICEIVIELKLVPPGLLRVAPIARLTELAVMRILGTMTIHAAPA